MIRAFAGLVAGLVLEPTTHAALSHKLPPAMLPERPPPKVPALTPGEDEAVVYILRTDPPGQGIDAATVLVDEVKVVGLYSGRCTAFKVPAGVHFLSVHWSWYSGMAPGYVGPLKWEPGHGYRYLLNLSYRSDYPRSITYIWQIVEGAPADFADCYYVKPINLDKIPQNAPQLANPGRG